MTSWSSGTFRNIRFWGFPPQWQLGHFQCPNIFGFSPQCQLGFRIFGSLSCWVSLQNDMDCLRVLSSTDSGVEMQNRKSQVLARGLIEYTVIVGQVVQVALSRRWGSRTDWNLGSKMRVIVEAFKESVMWWSSQTVWEPNLSWSSVMRVFVVWGF